MFHYKSFFCGNNSCLFSQVHDQQQHQTQMVNSKFSKLYFLKKKTPLDSDMYVCMYVCMLEITLAVMPMEQAADWAKGRGP